MNSTRRFLPKLYENIPEFDGIVNADDEILEYAGGNFSDFIDNLYVLNAAEAGIRQYEADLGITPDPLTETLSFRRQRVLNRMSLRLPFTEEYLRQKLDVVIGAGKYDLLVDHLNYTLYIESSAEDQKWFDEIIITITGIKPANMVFINRPLVTASIELNETLSYRTLIYNYRVGVSWNLGANPFVSTEEQGVIKMADTPSVQQQLLDDVATFTASDIASVLINDTVSKTVFDTKTASDGVVTVEYGIEFGEVENVTSIKLKDSSGNTLTASTVFVPVLQDLVIKHLINTQEGI